MSAREFRYYRKTYKPEELEGWEDMSWMNDASASCWLRVPTEADPGAVLVLWIQPDDRKDWNLPDQKKYQLDLMLDGDAGWDETSRILLESHDLAEVMEAVERHKNGVAL